MLVVLLMLGVAVAGPAYYQPERQVHPAIVSLASTFSCVCIICFRDACSGLHLAWPMHMLGRVHVFDAFEIYRAVGLNNVDKRHDRATAISHGWVAELLMNQSAQDALVLEGDFRLALEGAGSEGALEATVGDVRAFLRGQEPWEFLRLGYYPVMNSSLADRSRRVKDPCTTPRSERDEKACVWTGGACPADCLCQRLPHAPRICSVTRPCDVRSIVAYAVHATGLPKLAELGREARVRARGAVYNLTGVHDL